MLPTVSTAYTGMCYPDSPSFEKWSLVLPKVDDWNSDDCHVTSFTVTEVASLRQGKFQDSSCLLYLTTNSMRNILKNQIRAFYSLARSVIFSIFIIGILSPQIRLSASWFDVFTFRVHTHTYVRGRESFGAVAEGQRVPSRLHAESPMQGLIPRPQGHDPCWNRVGCPTDCALQVSPMYMFCFCFCFKKSQRWSNKSTV